MPFVLRQLPAVYVPGVALSVTLQSLPASSVSAYAVEDQPPAGWTVANPSHGGVFDVQNNKVKFGPFFDSQSRTLTYQVTPPAEETGSKSFNGVGSTDGTVTLVVGDTRITSAGAHPADLQPDYRVSISEVTAYGSSWRNGARWAAGPSTITMDYLTRAGALWRNGEKYTLDNTAKPPLCWVSTAATKAPAPGYAGMPGSSASTVVRRLPSVFIPGQPVTLQLTATPAVGVTAYAVEESIPAGWTVSNISDGGQFDALHGKVKWGAFLDPIQRTVTCTLTSPANISVRPSFVGAASFDGVSVATAGAQQMTTGTRLAGAVAVGAGQIQMSVNGRLGAVYEIQVSTDLRSWSTLTTATNADGRLNFQDAASTGATVRFYRVKLVE
jgi:hypothetical protein